MVAGYHNGAYARFTTLGYRRFDFGTYRVYHARKTYVAEVVFNFRGFCIYGFFFMFFFRGAEYAQRFVRHSFVFCKNLFANFFRHREFFAVFKIMRAMFQHFVGCTLCELHDMPAVFDYDAHHFSH